MLPREPHLMLSIINLKLRDYYSSLEELCDDLEDDPDEIKTILEQIGYYYQPVENQFKPKSE